MVEQIALKLQKHTEVKLNNNRACVGRPGKYCLHGEKPSSLSGISSALR